MTTDSKLVVFCNQLVISNSSNLQIMLCSPNPPVLEGSSDIAFLPVVYTHHDLLHQMHLAGLSIWNNCWDEVCDTTPDMINPD
mmetsp:Transcript_26899/g.35976  ORF Transcript_26899/g.35976 Transcript_26899/m.35976 type:complete len:83 (-) Transcript_26899:28-276(-)